MADFNAREVEIKNEDGNYIPIKISDGTYTAEVTNDNRLKVTGSAAIIPSALDQLRIGYCETSGGSKEMDVDGSSTPVEFTYDACATADVYLYEVRFLFVDSTISFNGKNFCGRNELTNGIKVELTSGGTTVTLTEFFITEDIFLWASPGGIEFHSEAADLLLATLTLCGNVKLDKNSSDQLKITVRDDLTGLNLVRCRVFAVEG